MGFFDLFKKKPKESYNTCIKCKKKATISGNTLITASYVCPDCDTLSRLQSCDSEIIDIDRQANGPERILSVLLYNTDVGYFCVRQSSGAYSGLGLWYCILPKDAVNPHIEDYTIDYENFICVPNQWFSRAFSDDIYGKKRLSVGDKLTNLEI